ncbi:rhomboid family intramembrane serine protease [Pasteurellaceae bacterium 22721_9_1]
MLSIFRSHPPKFTLFITALCGILFIFSHLIDFDVLINFFNFPIDYNEQQDYWRYFSHTLIHLSIMHIGFNLSWWWLFGGAIEKKFGTFSLVILYFLSAIISGFAQNWASGPLFFGLSGVVYAVMGFVFIVDKLNPHTQFDLPEGFFTMIIVGILFGFAAPLIDVAVGNAAHIAGLITGLAYGFLFTKVKK